MKLSIKFVTRPIKSQTWQRVIVLILVVITARTSGPSVALPLGLGGWLGVRAAHAHAPSNLGSSQ